VIPTGVKYCDIEICGGGGGGGGGIGQYVTQVPDNNNIIFGGAGGAGGTYYKITLNVSNYKSYKMKCGHGGSVGEGFNYSNSGYYNDGGTGGTSNIEFYDNDASLVYKINALGGHGGERGITTNFDENTVPPMVGTNLVYNNNGSIYKFSKKIANILDNKDSDSNYNQPSGGGGGGGSIFYNKSGLLDDLDYYGSVGLPGLNGGSIHLTNNNSSICYNGSLGSYETKWISTGYTNGYYRGSNGDDSSNNQFSGGGGGSYGGYVDNYYIGLSLKTDLVKIDNTNNNRGGDGGNGYRGGGGGGGGAAITNGSLVTGGNGGVGGSGFVTLYFY